MTVRKTCARCGHTASVVLYGLATCPRCGALYAKTEEAQAAAQAAAGRAARKKVALLQVVTVAVVVLGGATWFATSYLERQELRAAVDDIVRWGAVMADDQAAAAQRAALGDERIAAERLKYRVTVSAARAGTEAATIEVTNGSAVTLPYLTLETHRYFNGVLASDATGRDLQLKEAAEPLARAHGAAFVRSVAAIASCRNALPAALAVRRQDGGEFAVFVSEDG